MSLEPPRPPIATVELPVAQYIACGTCNQPCIVRTLTLRPASMLRCTDCIQKALR